ncbi:MAG: tRNA uridine-5-carboxymethylaminomethyl(34) synthesis GTPase MnmE, partial [Bacteroidales bacterium]
MQSENTICALATSGHGAIAVIRISGPRTYDIVDHIFQPSTKGKKLAAQSPQTIHLGTICDGKTVIDEVLLSLFRAPHSYTGEDAIEISCHASPYIEQKILELLIREGATPARPGEFTQRAFLNGKMDLSQAEAVADLIAAESEGAHRVALQQLRGGFADQLKLLRDRLLHFISMIELELDFSEEDVEFADRGQLKTLVEEIGGLIDRLLTSFSLGNVLKNGVPVAIVGRPNVGKSTLLNALLNEERAIVSDIEGTTRDSIEDTVNLGGITFRFIDTAGIRETAEPIENLGIRRTYQKIGQASIVLLIVEATDAADLIRRSLEEIRKQLEGTGKELVVVLNKSDRLPSAKTDQLTEGIELSEHEHIIAVSADRGQNIEGLTALLLDLV